MKLRNWSRLALVAAVALASRQAGAQVMNQVPDNATVVVKIASLQKTSAKISSLAQKIGIAQMVPQLQDPMAALTKKMHDPKGLNKDGDLAFVMLNPEAAGGDEGKSVLALIPVSDYKALIGGMENAKTEAGITEGKFPGQNDTAYVAQWGDYAAVSPTKEIVATKPAQVLKLQPVAGREIGEKDIAVYANIAQVRTKAIAELQKNRQQVLARMERDIAAAQPAPPAGNAAAAPGANPQMATVAKAVANQGFNLLQQLLQDTEAVAWGLNLSDDGIKGSLVAEFAPSSYVGQFASAAKNTDQSLTSALPAGNYFFFGGYKMDPERIGKLIDDLANPVLKDIKAAGVDTAGMEKYVASIRQAYTASENNQMGMVAPTGALGQEAMFQTVTVIGGDADKITAGMQGMFTSMPDLMKSFFGSADAVKVNVTPGEKKVDGLALDHVKAQVNLGGNTPQGAQLQQMMSFMYGPDGINLYAGKIDDKHVLVASGAPDEVIARTVKSAKANEDALGKLEQVKTVNAQLPANRMAVFYVPVDNIVSTGVAYAKQFGMPIQLQLPPNLPPIGAAISTEGDAYRMDGFLPAPLVQSLVAAGMQAFMAMQGGGGGAGAQPGGPGGL